MHCIAREDAVLKNNIASNHYCYCIISEGGVEGKGPGGRLGGGGSIMYNVNAAHREVAAEAGAVT